jgi:RNA polymerase sigma factor (sigma-70 family)
MRTEGRVVEAADDGFGRFFAREYRAVVGLAFVLCGRLDGAEDLAQAAFAAAYRDWARIGNYDDPGGWIRRVVANRAVSLRRRRSVEASALRRLAGRRSVPDPEIAIEDAAVWSAVRSLPRRQAQLIALVYLEDRSVRDAAAILGCGEETAKTHLRRGRAAVAKRVAVRQSEEFT